MKNCLALAVLLFGCALCAIAQESAKAEESEAAYTRTIQERADKIAVTLGVTNTQFTIVRDIIAGQYRDLRRIHDARDAKLKTLKAASSLEKAARDAAITSAQNDAKTALDKLHKEFLSRLSAQLTPEQVDKVKDGLTYDVLHVTYNAYLKMYPDLKEDQKAQIKSWLTEARETAMDQGTSKEKHAVFGKYKGRINNYLSKAGYDAKKAEENLKK
jgi:Spy/CpxP family protein refolding chaperone